MIYIYLEKSVEGLKKSSLEAIAFAQHLAHDLHSEIKGICLGNINKELVKQTAGQFGLSHIINLKANSEMDHFDAQVFSSIICQKLDSKKDNLVFCNTLEGKALAPRVSVKLNWGFINNVQNYIAANECKKTVFSGKAYLSCKTTANNNVWAINPNSFDPNKSPVACSIDEEIIETSPSKLKLIEKAKTSDKINLADANIVVSAGRGLKGPENWGMIEELANSLKAATACSRPVADLNWRPHHEHVGQTGLQINPNLYIAIGISGAIQHLAGVNRSKNIVVINTDKEAPFIKAADFAIIGDCFEIVPKLTASIKKIR